jgi:hypothetical protein
LRKGARMGERFDQRRLIFHLENQIEGPHLIEGGDAAKVLWELTQHGTVGNEFVWCEPNGIPRCYLVIDSAAHGKEVHVTCLPSVAEPTDVPQMIECEQCGTQAMVLSSSAIYDMPKGGNERERQLRLSIDCRTCGRRGQVVTC